MTGGPHPYSMTRVDEQRRAEILAQADRDRQALLAQPQGDRRQLVELFALVAMVVALALLAAAGASVA